MPVDHSAAADRRATVALQVRSGAPASWALEETPERATEEARMELAEPRVALAEPRVVPAEPQAALVEVAARAEQREAQEQEGLAVRSHKRPCWACTAATR